MQLTNIISKCIPLQTGSTIKIETTYDSYPNNLVSKIQTIEEFISKYIQLFKKVTGNDYNQNKEYMDRLKTIGYYILGDQRFFNSPLLNSTLTKPSLSKGLLIIGDYGVGKTALLQVFSEFVRLYSNKRFTFHTVLDLVSEFEGLTRSEDRKEFYTKYCNGRRIFDDATTEKDASNYGKSNLLKDILEVRSEIKFPTIMSCNYDDLHPKDIDKALDMLQERYGSRVFDRLFSMFNFIEFNGKSLRK